MGQFLNPRLEGSSFLSVKALVLTSPDGSVDFREVEEPVPAPGLAVVKLRAAALNRRDFWITRGGYPNIQAPCILGSDGTGTVEAVGEGVETSWVGREVVIYPSLDWGDSEQAQGEHFRILGMPDHGTFAEKISIPAQQLVPKPAHLSSTEAAALPLAGLTAYRALFPQGQLQSGELLLITGIGGGVATWALKCALAAGVRVLVTSSSQDKLARAVSLGASAGFDYRDTGWTSNVVRDYGQVDMILDSAAGDQFGDLLGIVRPGGRVVSYGGTASTSIKIPIRAHFWNQLRLIGSTMGSPRDFASMTAFVAEHGLRPEIHSVTPLCEGAGLIQSMADFPQVGKLVLETP